MILRALNFGAKLRARFALIQITAGLKPALPVAAYFSPSCAATAFAYARA